MGAAMKYFPKKLPSHAIFRSMASGRQNVFLKKCQTLRLKEEQAKHKLSVRAAKSNLRDGASKYKLRARDNNLGWEPKNTNILYNKRFSHMFLLLKI